MSKADTPVLTEVDVLITKDAMSKVPITVWAHEVPALIVTHGEDHVQVIEEREAEAPGFNAGNEWQRLRRKYDRMGTGRLQAAYPLGAKQVAELAGVPLDAANEEPQAVIRRAPRKEVVRKQAAKKAGGE